MDTRSVPWKPTPPQYQKGHSSRKLLSALCFAASDRGRNEWRYLLLTPMKAALAMRVGSFSSVDTLPQNKTGHMWLAHGRREFWTALPESPISICANVEMQTGGKKLA